MTYDRFEDLPVWKEAIHLAQQVCALTEQAVFQKRWSLRDQVERAAISVSNNIAEGFERGTTSELLAFLYIARGSAGEVRSMLCLIEQLPPFRDLKSQISNLKSIAESCSRQLRAWADSLQNSEIRGQRHLSRQSREMDDRKAKAEALDKKLVGLLPENHPLRQFKSRPRP